MNLEATIMQAMSDEWKTLPLAKVVRKENIPGHVEFMFAWEAEDLQVMVRITITAQGTLRETMQIKDCRSRSLIASETKMHGAHFVNLYEMRKNIRFGADNETVVRTALEGALCSLQSNPSRSAARLRRKDWQPIGGAVYEPFSIVQGGAPGLGKRA